MPSPGERSWMVKKRYTNTTLSHLQHESMCSGLYPSPGIHFYKPSIQTKSQRPSLKWKQKTQADMSSRHILIMKTMHKVTSTSELPPSFHSRRRKRPKKGNSWLDCYTFSKCSLLTNTSIYKHLSAIKWRHQLLAIKEGEVAGFWTLISCSHHKLSLKHNIPYILAWVHL